MFRLVTILIVLGSAQAAPRLMPMPARISERPGHLTIDSSFRMAAAFHNARLEAAMARTEARIFREFGFASIAERRVALTIECRQSGPVNPTLGDDESYVLDVEPAGARLTAGTVAGALRGMETFVQLIEPAASGFQAPAVHIEDHPRFQWRGLMLDVSRHWMPVDVVKRNLDAMAAVKLNVFHWHLSDDQGFRVESRRFPKLQQLGSDGNFYTQQQIRDVVGYASDRGIRVVPEFDVPGHTSSWFVGYPELASAPGPYHIERTWGIFQPTMNPAREETYAFLDAFVGEMAALFPDPYFHIGGDEVDETQWKNSGTVQAFARDHHLASSRELHGYFNQRLQKILRNHGKTMVGWNEVLAPGLDPDTVIQSWQGQQALAESAKKGYRGILSAGYYLDHLKPAAAHYAVDPMSGTDALTAEQAARILGGEACMWAEYVSSETVDSRIWPRMAAIAERFWSPPEVMDIHSMYDRLEAVSRVLQWTGVQHRSVYEPMLDRLGGGGDLRSLAAASEATGIEVRRDARKYTSLVDLNRFPDAVPPESEQVRHLEAAAARLTSADVAELAMAMRRWSENALSPGLASTGAIGLQALEFLRSGRHPGDGWISEQKKALDGLEKPSGEVVLAAVRPVRLLLDAVSAKTGPAPDRH